MTETAKKENLRLNTPLARLCFPVLNSPKQVLNQGDLFFQATLVFSPEVTKSDPFKALKTAAAKACRSKWGDKIPNPLRNPFYTAESLKKPTDGFDPGCIFIRCKTKTKPSCYFKDGTSMEDNDIRDQLYAGCYVQAIVSPWAYPGPGMPGVSFWLNGLRKIKDGANLGGGGARPEDFDPLPDEADPNPGQPDDEIPF